MIDLNVCVGSACHIKGSYNIITTFQQMIEEKNLSDKVIVKAVFCLGRCTKGISVRVNEEEVHSVSSATAIKFLETEVMARLDV